MFYVGLLTYTAFDVQTLFDDRVLPFYIRHLSGVHVRVALMSASSGL